MLTNVFNKIMFNKYKIYVFMESCVNRLKRDTFDFSIHTENRYLNNVLFEKMLNSVLGYLLGYYKK